MSRDDDTAVIIGVGVLFMAMRKSGGEVIPWGAGWQWPVPDAVIAGDRYPAVISNGFSSGPHYGVDIMFRRKTLMDQAQYSPGSSNGSTSYFAPPGTPIVAAKDARVWSVQKSPRGWSVVLDHGQPFATFYQHLERVDLELHVNGLPVGGKVPTHVKAGDMLGTMGADPLDGAHLRHLHFAVWYKGAGDNASVNPAGAMVTWKRPPTWQVP